MKARDALAALLISSYGDAAYAIAEYVGTTVDGFVEMMNDKAEELGLKNTHFTNPVGLHSPNNYSTAQDIYKLASYAFSIDIIKELSSKASYTLSSTNYNTSKEIYTSNILLDKNSDFYYKNAICGKTGFTNQAGHCLVSMASKNGTTYMAIILKANTYVGFEQKFKDSVNMYKWAFENFEYRTIFSTENTIEQFKVNHAKNCDSVKLYPDKELKALLKKNADLKGITIKHSNEQKTINAPVTAGEILAVADVYYRDEKIGTVNLIAKNDVQLNKFSRFMTSSKNAVVAFLISPIMIALYIILCMVILCFIILVVYLNSEKFQGAIKKPIRFIKVHIINTIKAKFNALIKK